MDTSRFLRLVSALWVLAAVQTAHSAGLWQQSAVYEQEPAALQGDPVHYRYRTVDTGGTGGMSGKGDVHNGLRSVDFWDESTGWAAGEGGIFRTGDGGLTWTRGFQDRGRRGVWWKIRMRSAREIWALEKFHGQPRARLFRTRDAGDTWTEVLQGRLRGAADLQVRGPDIFVFCGDQPSYRSSDGGRNWTRENFGGLLHGTLAASSPRKSATATENSLFVLGQFRRKLRLVASQDSGRTWRILPLPVDTTTPYIRARMYFASAGVGGIGLADGTLLFTADGGKTWKRSVTPSGQAVSALWMDKSGKGFYATENSDPSAPGVALSRADFRQGRYAPVQTASAEYREITGYRENLWAVGRVVGMIPNDVVLLVTPSQSTATD